MIVGIGVPILVSVLRVIAIKEIRNEDMFRATGRAVMTGCAGNHVLRTEDFFDFLDCFLFFFVQRFNILHERKVIFHIVEGSFNPGRIILMEGKEATKRRA
jgi:hypothetical protein